MLVVAGLVVGSAGRPGGVAAADAGVSTTAVTPAAVCSGYSDTNVPPLTIRVYRTGSGTVDTVDFKTYVEAVMAAEWPYSWPTEVLRAGAIAVKQYAWYYAIHWRGWTAPDGTCFDVRDDSIDQLYSPSRVPTQSQVDAVDNTWLESLTSPTRGFFLTGYRPDNVSGLSCGSDADGYHLFQQSARLCALGGKTAEQILAIYYTGAVVQATPTIPGAPTGLGAVAYDSAAYLHWTAPASNGGDAIRQYTVTAAPGGLTCTSTRTTCYLMGLTNGTGYTFTVTATNGMGTGPASDPTATVAIGAPASSTFHPVTPMRILDSRNNNGNLNGSFTSSQPRELRVTDRTDSPVPHGATAITGILGVLGSSTWGSLYASADADPSPATAAVRFPFGDDRANMVTIPLSDTGTIWITYTGASASAHANVSFDVTGFFTPDTSGSTYHPLTPKRILDTRGQIGGLYGRFSSGAVKTLGVAGVAYTGVPAGATAVTGILGIIAASTWGNLFVGPDADPVSLALHFPFGDDRVNPVTVPLTTGGGFNIKFVGANSRASTYVTFDITGYFTADASGMVYVPLRQTVRLLDTRNGTGGLAGTFVPAVPRELMVAGTAACPVPTTAAAVTGTLGIIGSNTWGNLYIGPVSTPVPPLFALNFPKLDDRVTTVFVDMSNTASDKGGLWITYVGPYSYSRANVSFDITGYFVPAP